MVEWKGAWRLSIKICAQSLGRHMCNHYLYHLKGWYQQPTVFSKFHPPICLSIPSCLPLWQYFSFSITPFQILLPEHSHYLYCIRKKLIIPSCNLPILSLSAWFTLMTDKLLDFSRCPQLQSPHNMWCVLVDNKHTCYERWKLQNKVHQVATN